MKKIKVSYMGKRLKDIYPHAIRIQVLRYKFNKFMEGAIVVAFILGIGAGIGYGVSKARGANASTIKFQDR